MKFLIVMQVSACYLGFAFIALASVGCGSSEPTVIQPGPDYQLTDEEVRMKAEIDAVPPPSY